MSSEPSDIVKATSMQIAHGQPPSGDSQIDLIMQSLMIDDPDVKRILKGEVSEILTRLNQLYVILRQQTDNMLENPLAITKENSSLNYALLQIKKTLGDIAIKELEIQDQLENYQEYLPYLLLLTPSTVLSNITSQQADAVFRKMDIMLMRSKLKSKYKGKTMDSRNFFDAIGIKLYLQLRRSIDAQTFRGLVEENRKVSTVIEDRTLQKKRRRFF